MRTKIHFYRFNLPEQKEQWDTLRAFLDEEIGRKNRMKAIGTHNTPFKEGEEIELSGKHMFSNQWNTVGEKGVRVFDWWQEVNFANGREVRSYVNGHWLEQTNEMRQVREKTLVCGFCGHREPAAGADKFCGACLGSHYLGENHLHLLRMLPVAERFPDRPPLTDDERAWLLPKYIQAQTAAGAARDKERREKEVAKIKLDYDIGPNDAVGMTMKAGQFVIFTERVIHGSPPNRSPDRRRTSHHIHQGFLARHVFLSQSIGYHLAHHVDSGIPMANLPTLHRALKEDGYLPPELIHPSYRSFWRTLAQPA